jgi:hypothetical protein
MGNEKDFLGEDKKDWLAEDISINDVDILNMYLSSAIKNLLMFDTVCSLFLVDKNITDDSRKRILADFSLPPHTKILQENQIGNELRIDGEVFAKLYMLKGIVTLLKEDKEFLQKAKTIVPNNKMVNKECIIN